MTVETARAILTLPEEQSARLSIMAFRHMMEEVQEKYFIQDLKRIRERAYQAARTQGRISSLLIGEPCGYCASLHHQDRCTSCGAPRRKEKSAISPCY